MASQSRADAARLTECPFCDADLSDIAPPLHLETCEAFRAAFGIQPAA